MPTRKNSNRQKSKDGGDLRAIYAQYRKDFTAADLQKYALIEEGLPLEKLIAELEAIHKRVTRKKK